MEEQVGIFDPDGLLAYAAYFRDALVCGPSIELVVLSEEDECPSTVDLVLQYKIGTTILEGHLKVWSKLYYFPIEYYWIWRKIRFI